MLMSLTYSITVFDSTVMVQPKKIKLLFTQKHKAVAPKYCSCGKFC